MPASKVEAFTIPRIQDPGKVTKFSDFMTPIVGGYDFVNVLTNSEKVNTLSNFDKAIASVRQKDIVDQVRVIDGEAKDALEIGFVFAGISKMIEADSTVDNIKLTQEAKDELGYWLGSSAEGLFKNGAVIAQEVMNTIKDKVAQAMREQVIKIFA